MKNNNVYETPVVTKVEYDASDRITASGCTTVSYPANVFCTFEN